MKELKKTTLHQLSQKRIIIKTIEKETITKKVKTEAVAVAGTFKHLRDITNSGGKNDQINAIAKKKEEKKKVLILDKIESVKAKDIKV